MINVFLPKSRVAKVSRNFQTLLKYYRVEAMNSKNNISADLTGGCQPIGEIFVVLEHIFLLAKDNLSSVMPLDKQKRNVRGFSRRRLWIYVFIQHLDVS